MEGRQQAEAWMFDLDDEDKAALYATRDRIAKNRENIAHLRDRFCDVLSGDEIASLNLIGVILSKIQGDFDKLLSGELSDAAVLRTLDQIRSAFSELPDTL